MADGNALVTWPSRSPMLAELAEKGSARSSRPVPTANRAPAPPRSPYEMARARVVAAVHRQPFGAIGLPLLLALLLDPAREPRDIDLRLQFDAADEPETHY